MTVDLAEIAEGRRLRALFAARGADIVRADILQPANRLLDLYGEDIRARAYVTGDPLRGEMMLRPDFTVPVVMAHLASGAASGRYAYAGKVFRKQETDPDRPVEYEQAGYEVIGGGDPVAADAEVFVAIKEGLGDLPVAATIGDLGILTAAVRGLRTSEARKAALMRHVWRPGRFRALLDRFAGRVAPDPARQRLLAMDDPLEGAGPFIGLRGRNEIEERIARLRAEAAEPPLPQGDIAAIDAILALRETAPNVLSALRDIAMDLSEIGGAVDRLARRLDALSARGVDVAALAMEGGFGRSMLEYYDGFVFGFSGVTRPDLPPVATGGRYDALVSVLGRDVPAVGGMIRPARCLALRAGGRA